MKLITFFTITILSISFTNAQEDEITVVSSDACECLGEIDNLQERSAKYEAIETCISSAIMSYQLKDALLNLTEKVKDTLSKTDITKVDSVTIPEDQNIVIDSNKNYKQIENELLRSCQSMQLLMTSEDTKSEVSMSDKKKAVQFYEKGQGYFANEKYANAITEYAKAVKKDKNFAFAWDMLGFSYRKLNNYKEAIKNYKKSLEIDPRGRMPLMNIPIAYAHMQDYDKAIEGYKKMIEVYPDDPEGYYGIGRMYHQLGDYENALDNTMMAFNKYNEIGSPYARDAEHNLVLYYNELKEQNKLEIFEQMAKKHNIQIE